LSRYFSLSCSREEIISKVNISLGNKKKASSVNCVFCLILSPDPLHSRHSLRGEVAKRGKGKRPKPSKTMVHVFPYTMYRSFNGFTPTNRELCRIATIAELRKKCGERRRNPYTGTMCRFKKIGITSKDNGICLRCFLKMKGIGAACTSEVNDRHHFYSSPAQSFNYMAFYIFIRTKLSSELGFYL